MNTKKYTSAAVALMVVAGLAAAVMVFAASNTPTNQPNSAWPAGMRGSGMNRGQGMMKPAVFGTVSGINGTTLTVSSQQGFGKNAATTATTFTVDASNAKVVKNNATSTVSDIAVGDTVFVQGTVSGTNVTATMIRDGKMRGGPGNPGGMNKVGWSVTSTPIQGNGQPVVAGTISGISGTTLTITNKSNVTYTIDASNVTVVKAGSTSSLSNVSVGDNVVVQGTVNGTSVVASSIIDEGSGNATTTNSAGNTGLNAHKGFIGGFLGGIGNFFQRLFGFL